MSQSEASDDGGRLGGVGGWVKEQANFRTQPPGGDKVERKSPEEIIENHTFEHPEGSTWERVKPDTLPKQVMAAAAFIAIVAGALYNYEMFAPAYQNPVVKRLGLDGLVFLGGFLIGTSYLLNTLRGLSWYVARLPDGVEVYFGRIDGTVTRNKEELWLFTPYLKFGKFGTTGRSLNLFDLPVDNIGQLLPKLNRGDDYTAYYGLSKNYTNHTSETVLGSFYVANIEGHEYEWRDPEVDILQTADLDSIDTDTARKLVGQIEQLETKLEHTETMKAQLEEIVEQQKKKDRERRGEFFDEVAEIVDTFSGTQRQPIVVDGKNSGDTVSEEVKNAVLGDDN